MKTIAIPASVKTIALDLFRQRHGIQARPSNYLGEWEDCLQEADEILTGGE